MEIFLRCGRWALAGLLGLLFICAILMAARPEACVRADLIEACTSQWEPSCAKLFATGAELSTPGWCTQYNYGVFFGIVIGAAGLFLVGAPLAVFMMLDGIFNVGARWFSVWIRRRIS